MIKSVDIQNFRCYEQLSLSNLGRVNVITGENASGKTALLEALYFSLGTPVLALKMRSWRGLGSVQISEAVESHNALWEDLFFEFDLGNTVAISIKGTDRFTRRVKIQHNRNSQIIIPAGKRLTDIQTAPPISFEYYKQSRRISSARLTFKDGNLTLSGGPEPLPGAFYSTGNPIDAREAGTWFSSLVKARQQKPIVEKIKKIFPFIEGLSVLDLNGIQVVHADIPSLPKQIPIGLVSYGVNKLIVLLIAIITQTKGIILVDEIENGIHYSIMQDAWSALYDFCREYHVQLFVSSHSLEALRKLYPVMEGHEKDFRLIRTERKNGQCTAHLFEGINFSSALEQGMDVR